MNKKNIPVITDREKLYDKCENMEQLFDKYYLPLLDKHYSKTYKLQQENKELKDLIDTILNWNIFKNECPMNFGYDEETNENKAQDVFYKDDDYCENNCNDDYTKCWLKYFKELQGIDSDE